MFARLPFKHLNSYFVWRKRGGRERGRAYSLLRALGKEEKETENSILAFTALQIEQSEIGNMKILNLQLCKFTNRAEIDLKSCINFQMCFYFFIIFLNWYLSTQFDIECIEVVSPC